MAGGDESQRQTPGAGTPDDGPRSPEIQRRRLTLLVKVAASAGDFSPQLAVAVERASDYEIRVMSDLVERGLSIPALVNVLQGAHVVVGDDELYEQWIFPSSRRRLSSHHRNVDKKATPDYGLAGPLVRESLHGKAVMGTWVQLERSMATFQFGKLPTWSDVEHLRDYVIYRVTGKNVGPWGLSALVDTRPMVLRPPNSTPSRAAGRAVAEFARRRADVDLSTQDRARWSAVLTPDVEPVGPAGDLFRAPTPDHPVELLPDAPYKDELGLGLFGSLPMVGVSAALRPEVARLLEVGVGEFATDSDDGIVEPVTIGAGSVTRRVRAVVQDAPNLRPMFVGIEEEQ